MKKFIVLIMLFVATAAWAAKFFDNVRVTDSVIVGTASAPDSAALLELRSTSKGLLLPRMTTAQRNAIMAPPDGLMIYNTDSATLEIYQTGSVSFVSPITGISDPTLATGDVIYRASSGALVRLAIGSASQVLTVSGGIPQWVNASGGSGGFSDPMTSIGDLIIRDGLNATTRLGIGAASQVLTVSGGLPQWVSLPADVGFADPLTTNGDLIVHSGGVTTRLGVGTAAQILTVSGGLPSWQNAVAGFSDPMTTRGDVIYRDAANATARLGLGSASQALFSDGTDLVWASVSYPADVGFADPMTTRGDVIYRDAANATARLGLGAVSQALFSDGTDLVWASISYPADVGFANPLTTNGDLIVQSGGITTRLPVGAASNILLVSGALPVWASYPVDIGFADPLTTNGDLLVHSGSITTRLPIGATSQVLTVSGGLPVWASSQGGGGGGSGWFASALIQSSAGYPELSAGAVSSYTEITKSDLTLTNNPNGIAMEIACASGTASSGTTCTAADESLGVALVPDSTCNAQICVALYHYMRCTAASACTVNATLSIAETTNASSAVVNQGDERVLSAMNLTASASNDDLNDSMRICGIFPVTEAVKSTFRLVYEKAADSNALSNSIGTFLGASRGDPGVTFTASCID